MLLGNFSSPFNRGVVIPSVGYSGATEPQGGINNLFVLFLEENNNPIILHCDKEQIISSY